MTTQEIKEKAAELIGCKPTGWAEGTYLQWKFDDNTQAWDDEWIYIFLGAFIVYLAASAIINKYKNNNKND